MILLMNIKDNSVDNINNQINPPPPSVISLPHLLFHNK